MPQKFSNFKGANYLELILKFVLWILVVAVGDKKLKSVFLFYFFGLYNFDLGHLALINITNIFDG